MAHGPLVGKELPTLLAIYSFCGCLIYFPFWCRGLDVDLIVSVLELTNLLNLAVLWFMACFA